MWLDNLKELKKNTNLSVKQIADKTKLPERTVNRILAGETDHPRVDTLHLIVTALGGSLNDIFADTNAVVATETLVEVKEVVEELEAEQDNILAENEALRAENISLKTEIQVLKDELLRKESQHKDELLSLVKYFTKINQNN
jgi:transcriptional regulator with XRE-family HTH domain